MSDNRPEGPPRAASVGLHLAERLRLESDGAPIRLSPTQQAYLLLLASADKEGLPRERVIRLLWDEAETRTTRHRLRQLSYAVNRKAGLLAVEADGPRVRLTAAVELHWGDELVGTGIRAPSARFADHLSEIHEQREREASLGSVRELDSARLADHPEAIVAALREGRRTPGSWRDLLWALLRMGRVREAEFELRRIIGDDLPVEGLPTARRVASRPDQLLSLAAAGGQAAIPLRAREDEVRQLHEKLISGASCILLTGARGVGRSRMLGQTVATLLSNQDDTVILAARGASYQLHTPFGGLAQLLSDELLVQAFGELGQPETEVIRRALPVQFESEDSHTLAELGGPGSYLRVARALARLFEIAYGRAEILLLVDDLDVMDRSTVEVVTRLVLLSPARMIATWCTDDSNGLNELLHRFHGVAPAIIPLLDLPLTEAAALARAVAPELTDMEADDVARLSGGRPGRVVELLQALGGAPALASPGMAPSLDDLLRKRVRDLTPAQQETLVVLAVSDGRLPVPAVGRVMDRGLLEVSGHVRGLEEAGLVEVEGSRAVVTSGLLRDFVRRELPGPVRRETHRAIAAQLLEDPETADPGFLAEHLLQSGQPVEAALWFKRGGMEALSRTAHAEALVLLERSVAANDELDPEIAQALGSIHSGMGDFKQAIHWFGRARIGYVERGDQVGDVEAVLKEVQASMEISTDTSGLVAEVMGQLCRADELRSGMLIGGALDLWLRLADYSHDSEILGGARQALMEYLSGPQHRDPWVALAGTRLVYLGQPQRGLALARLAYLGLRRNPLHRIQAFNRLIISHMVMGLPRGWRAQVLLREIERSAQGVGDLHARFSVLCNRALWAMEHGQWEEATQLLNAAERYSGGPRSVGAQTLATNRAVLAVRRGCTVDAVPFLDQMEAWVPSRRESINLVYAACRLLVALERGQVGRATRSFESLQSFDPSFPFSADLSLVPLAAATYLIRTGARSKAVELLTDAATGFAPHNPVAAMRVREAQSRAKGNHAVLL